MTKYRKKPVVIDAWQFTMENKDSIYRMLAEMQHDIYPSGTHLGETPSLIIPTLEGKMKAELNDFIIRGVNGEFYPCKPDIFEKTYEQV